MNAPASALDPNAQGRRASAALTASAFALLDFKGLLFTLFTMLIKKIRPEGSSFTYHPRVGDVCLATGNQLCGIRLYFNFNSQKFEFDRNPFGDPALRPLSNVTLSNDLSELQFDVVYRSRSTRFVISIEHECDKIIYDFFSRITDSGFSVMEDDLDDMQVAFEQGKLEFVRMFKHSKSNELLESLNIKVEGEKSFLIKQRPWRKITLDTVKVSDGNIISKAGKEEFIYRVETQPLIFDTIKRLIESSGSV